MRSNSWDDFGSAVAKMLMAGFSMMVVIVLAALLMGYPVKWCWNAVMPHISSGTLPEIGFWQALALTILAHILIKPAASSKGG